MASATPSVSVLGESTSAPEEGVLGRRGRMTTRSPGQMILVYRIVIYDKRAKYVGILRQSCKERTKTWKKVPPSC